MNRTRLLVSDVHVSDPNVQRCNIHANLAEGLALFCAGTAQSVGCTVEGEHPHDIIDKINNGQVEIPEVRAT